MSKLKIYLDGNIWQSLGLNWEQNKLNHPLIWKIFEYQNKKKIEILCSDIHRAEFQRSYAERHTSEQVKEKIEQCFAKSNTVAKTIIVLGNSTGGNSQFATQEEIAKFEQLRNILKSTDKKDKISAFDAHHLLTCFTNDVDVFITEDKNILLNIVKIKDLFNSWNKKKFIITTPEGFIKLKRFTTIVYYFIGLSLAVLLSKLLLNIGYLEMFIGFGLALNMLVFGFVINKINTIYDFSGTRRENLRKSLDYLKTAIALYYPIFALYSAFIFILANKGIYSAIFSSLWLLLTIFFFQIPLLWFVLYMFWRHFSKLTIRNTFIFGYLILSAMFGWTSAYLAKDILYIPPTLDLTIATYGLLILPYCFLKFCEKTLRIY